MKIVEEYANNGSIVHGSVKNGFRQRRCTCDKEENSRLFRWHALSSYSLSRRQIYILTHSTRNIRRIDTTAFAIVLSHIRFHYITHKVCFETFWKWSRLDTCTREDTRKTDFFLYFLIYLHQITLSKSFLY